MSARQRFAFNIFYFFVLFIWPVFKTFYFKLDGAGRVESIMTIIAIVVNGRSLFRGPGVMKIWILWVAYALINLYYKGYYYDYPFFWWMMTQLVCPLISMLIMYNCAVFNKDKLIRIIFIYFLLFIIIGALQMTRSGTDRYGNDMGNSYLNNAIFIIPYISLVLKNQKQKLPYYLVIIFLIFIILLSGERKALAGLFIMIMAYMFARNSSRSVTSVVVVISIILLTYIGVSYIMENTTAGNRFNDQFAETQYEDSFFLTLMGDRAYMYEDGFLVFLQHPWTGLGLTNFIYNPINIKGHTLHSEYMVELTECGIIGSSLFLIFYFSMIYRLIKMFRSKQIPYETIILAGALLAIIEINFTAWTYCYPYYFMLFGLLFAYYDLIMNKAKI